MQLGRAGREAGSRPGIIGFMTFPKIELHVHLEGTIRPATLLRIARRNKVPLPADTVEGVAALYQYRDFAHFIETWMVTTGVLRTEADFREIVVEYAAEAAGHGAVYVEGIFSPAEPVRRGARWAEVFAGYCDGALEARERYGVHVRLTPDVTRGFPAAAAVQTARQSVAHAGRGVVGLGLGGSEDYGPEPYAGAFALARDGGLPAVPHAGEIAGPASVRAALDVLDAVRIRHGIRAAEDPALLRDLAGRGIVLDVCPTSNVATGAVPALSAHPLPALRAAGVPCTISTDDPAMFGTDLAAEYAVAARLGASPEDCYRAGLAGALCDTATRREIEAIGQSFDWSAVAAVPAEQA
jgi:aminodeoxyfutalosine deaminase